MPTNPSPETMTAQERRGAQRSGMNNTIMTQCFGALAFLALGNGTLLVYLNSAGLASSLILLLLALPTLVNAVFGLGSAILSERYSPKRVGRLGAVLQPVGFALITLSAFFHTMTLFMVFFVLGMLIFAVGCSLYGAGWFALLSPVVPENVRGRFFGRLRTSWQLVGIVFAAICAFLLTAESPRWVFVLILGALTVALVIRIVFYLRIPDLNEEPPMMLKDLKAVLRQILQADGFVPFTAYIFLLALFTAGCPFLFGLVEKRVLNWGDNLVVWMGNLAMIGAMGGFYVGGKSVDHFGPRRVFLWSHVGFACIIFLFLLRVHMPASLVFALVALANFGFGFIGAAQSIGVTSELLALIPRQGKSLSTTMFIMVNQAGAGLSSLICSWSLGLGLLNPNWTFMGQTMTQYDTILLVYGFMIAVMVVTLGLVPSVLGKSQWLPRGG